MNSCRDAAQTGDRNQSPVRSLERRYKRAQQGLMFAMVVLGIGTLYLNILFNAYFLSGLALLVPLIVVALRLSGRRRELRSLARLREDWGSAEPPKDRDLTAARMLFDSLASKDARSFVDEQTWRDLNMDQLYSRIDRTYTDPGEAVLYRILREPLLDREELGRRGNDISSLQADRELRESVQVPLVRLGHQRMRNGLFALLWRDELPRTRIGPLFTAMALVAVASLFLPVVFRSGILIIVPVMMFVTNLVTHYYIKRSKDLETMSFPYLIDCVKAAGTLSTMARGGMGGHAERLAILYRDCRSVMKKARFLFPASHGFADMVEVFYEYLNIFFLLEIRAFYGTANELAHHLPELRELYEVLGELDALQSIASYRSSLAIWTDPTFADSAMPLEIRGAQQPLLQNPVASSISIQKNIVVITGSNMGGKSTFLRTVGNSVLMAQTIATVPAEYYRGVPFSIITSISRTDDLVAGKSFYYVEAERILKTLRGLRQEVTTLCIIDELLSGTNSAERVRASEAIIRYLGKQNAVAIIATHDLDLAEHLNGRCDLYHFTGTVDETGLRFDYVLRPGVVKMGNAIALLEYLGYPKEITQEAAKKDRPT